jgi:hypothetical protein
LHAVFGWEDEEMGDWAIREERGSLKGPRPPLPFLTYEFMLVDMPNGMDEEVPLDDGYGITGGRMATLVMTGYGTGAEELLTRLALAARPPLTDPLTIINLGPLLDISTLDETTIEPRYTKDFTVLYRLNFEEPLIPVVWANTIKVNDEEINR